MYGVRARGADGSAHGVLLFNSNGMDVVPAADRLTYRAVGGVLDLFFLLGPTPLDVMDQLTRLVGRPALPAYWALGLMNSKRAPARRRSDLPPGPLLWGICAGKAGSATVCRCPAVRCAVGGMGGCAERPAGPARVLHVPRQTSRVSLANMRASSPEPRSWEGVFATLQRRRRPWRGSPAPCAGTATRALRNTAPSWTGTGRPASRWGRS
jgi:hypothetical protein